MSYRAYHDYDDDRDVITSAVRRPSRCGAPAADRLVVCGDEAA